MLLRESALIGKLVKVIENTSKVNRHITVYILHIDEPGSWVFSGCEKLEVISDNNAVSSLEKRDETSDTISSKGTFQFSKLGYFGVLFVSGCISVCHAVITVLLLCFRILIPRQGHFLRL